MENPFKNLASDHSVPNNVKDELNSSIDSLKMFTDLVDLFFVKAASVIGQSFSHGEERLGDDPYEKFDA